ncbi:MAG: Cof-type HAD-IIB family hydrolase [Brotaphodocola sp.]
MDYKMIVLDLDGTLTNRDKIITQHTKDVLKQAMEKGKIVVLASGRPTCGVTPLADELELEKYGGYILAFNGGVIQDCRRKQVVVKKMLPTEYHRKITELADRERVALMTYQDDWIITNDEESEYVQLESRINHMKIRQVENMAEYVDFEVPKMIMTDDGDYLASVEGRVKAALGKHLSVYRSEPFFLEILPRDIDKAHRLEKLLSLLGISREEIIACGDGYNDLTMIRYAGLGVAMENAVLPVRNAADYITLSNNDDGVAHVVEKFLL